MRKLWLLALLLLMASPAWAGIAFDATANSGIRTVASFSYTHTVGAGVTNGLIVASVGGLSGALITVSSITYGGVSLTLIRRDAKPDGSAWTELWQLKAPATGANSVAVTLSAAPTSVVVTTYSLSGVDQGTPNDANSGGGRIGGQPSVSVQTVARNAWLVDAAIDDTASSLTVCAGQTNAVSLAGSGAGASIKAATAVGATTMCWTGAAGDGAGSAASFKPAVCAAVSDVLVQCNGANSSSSVISLSQPFGAPVTAGNELIAVINWGSNAAMTLTVSDTVNAGTWTQATQLASGAASTLTLAIYYKENTAAGTPTVTVSSTVVAAFDQLYVLEVSGRATSASLDGSASGNGTTANPSVNITDAAANDFVVGITASLAGPLATAGAGFTQLDDGTVGFDTAERQVATGTGTIAVTFTAGASTWSVSAASFKPAAAAPAGFNKRKKLEKLGLT